MQNVQTFANGMRVVTMLRPAKAIKVETGVIVTQGASALPTRLSDAEFKALVRESWQIAKKHGLTAARDFALASGQPKIAARFDEQMARVAHNIWRQMESDDPKVKITLDVAVNLAEKARHVTFATILRVGTKMPATLTMEEIELRRMAVKKAA